MPPKDISPCLAQLVPSVAAELLAKTRLDAAVAIFEELAVPVATRLCRLLPRQRRTEILEAGFQGHAMRPIRPSRLPELLRRTSLPEGTSGTDAPAPAPAAESATPAEHTARTEDRVKVLVAEDNVVNQRVAQGILEKLGCEVSLAADGREALRMVRENPPDLVFMDCQMPHMDGYEATREIRKLDGAAASVPIVAMTAHAMDGDREHCLAVGMNDYVAKPVKMASVRDAVTRWSRGAAPASA